MTSDSSVVRSTGSMAVATLLSRITGFIRTVMITSALGGAVASAFNTANTLPNMITEIVLGSVLTALVVPVLVRAEKEDPDHGAAFIRRLFTLTVTLLTAVTVLTLIGAPLLTRLMLDGEGQVNVFQATSFAYLLLPQIMFYGLFSLFMAILNTKEVFRPGAWAPVANNLVTITVMALYLGLPGSIDPKAETPITDPHILLLGLGTTAGVVVQCLIMLPALKRLNIDLRPLWGIDDRLKQFGGMALAIIAYVAISQLGYIINNRIASSVDSSAPAIYMQHWQLLQVPYGIIGVTLLTAIMPRLSRNAADGDDRNVVRDLTLGTKLTFIALIPIIIFMTALGPDIGNALFGYGAFTDAEARTLGMTLSFSAFTLIPYALVMLHLRVFYAREEAWTPTFIIAGITATKVVLAMLAPLIASEPGQVVVLLGAANGFGFVAGAIIGAFLLRRKLGSLRAGAVLHTTVWAAAAGLVGIAAALFARYLLRLLPGTLGGLTESLGLRESLGLLIELGLVGVVFLAVTGAVLAFSGLPEVQNVGRALSRLPGMGRIIRPDVERQIEVGEVDPQDVSAQLLVDDTFNTSPVPPPMSAGVVRGPRLVPGAAVSDGRFRLQRFHGSSTSAQFWQAQELKTGRMVALTFVDTCGTAPMAPVKPRQAAIEAAGIGYRTKKLDELRLPAVAPLIDVITYRTGCVIVADWVPGSSLQAVAESGEPLVEGAVAGALVPLTQAVAQAHAAEVPLGLDNRHRMRVSEDGVVVLAFPAVLPDADMESDASAHAFAFELLASSVEPPAEQGELSPLCAKTRTLETPAGYADLAAELEAIATSPVTVTEQPDVAPAPVHGFGARRMGAAGASTLVAVAITAVVLVAALTAYLISELNRDPNSPITEDSVEKARENAMPVFISPLAAVPWGNDPGTGGYGALVDGDEDTAVSLAAGNQVSIAPDDTRAGDAFRPQRLIVHSDAPESGTLLQYTIYAVEQGQQHAESVSELTVLASDNLKEERLEIELPKGQTPLSAVVISMSNQSGSATGSASGDVSVNVSEVEIVGTRVK